MQKSALFAQAPRWQAPAAYDPAAHGPRIHSWLAETGSLTQRLRRQYGAAFGVRLLRRQWLPPFSDESLLLELNPRHFQLIREVLLHAGGRPLILARSVLPAAAARIPGHNLARLGARPLGEVLFAQPDLERRRVQYTDTPSRIWRSELAQILTLPPQIPGRRTVYAIRQHPLLVAEFFLPGIIAD